ncbi:Dam family site-specific DNA-(adenine-N6)-methyltransferase [Amphibacillus sp. Q70]|uniref:Dam family site-specific DNA-(adenine-N6)-methyltransferase n=1 Tax=Amphibacillus sp. Q70 TaxID=3453416 RepID=UPI003F828792
MQVSTSHIHSAFNYTGAKYRLLPQLIPLFPAKSEYTNFIDLFAGGGSVAINIQSNYKIYMNDVEKHIIEVFQLFKEIAYDDLLTRINHMITDYQLSDTKTYGYEYYGVNSSIGVSKYNKPRFLKLREDYNTNVFSTTDRIIAFYLLTVYGFNNQVRFNSNGEYNLPVGKRDFNINMKRKLQKFHQTLNLKEFVFSYKDFREFNHLENNDFIYADPPYRITTASYNENGNWSLKDDMDLFEYLDKADKIGIKFALSNVTVHNGRENTELLDWATKYNTNKLNFNYNNSNYQSKAKKTITEEVLITNY